MAISYISGSSTTYASRTNTTITAPASIANDDLLLLTIITAASSDAPDPSSVPADFTIIGAAIDVQDGSAYNLEARSYYKRASSESGDYTVNHASCTSQGHIHVFRGVDWVTGPFDATQTENSSTGLTRTWTGLTTVTNGAVIVAIGSDWANTTNNLTPPGGMTEVLDNTLSYVAYEMIAAAGATGDRSHTSNNNEVGGYNIARLIALRPDGGFTQTTFLSKGTLGTTGGGTTNEASIVLTTATTALAVGNFAVVCYACDNAGSSDADEGAVSGVVDNAASTTNVWTKAIEFANGQSGAGTGHVISVWVCDVTTALAVGGTITATLTSTSARDATSVSGWAFTKPAGTLAALVTTASSASDGATAMPSLDATTAYMSALRVRASGIEYGTALQALTATASPAFTKFDDDSIGTTAAGSSVRAEWIISTGTSAASAPSTTFTAADMASVYAAFRLRASLPYDSRALQYLSVR